MELLAGSLLTFKMPSKLVPSDDGSLLCPSDLLNRSS